MHYHVLPFVDWRRKKQRLNCAQRKRRTAPFATPLPRRLPALRTWPSRLVLTGRARLHARPALSDLCHRNGCGIRPFLDPVPRPIGRTTGRAKPPRPRCAARAADTSGYVLEPSHGARAAPCHGSGTASARPDGSDAVGADAACIRCRRRLPEFRCGCQHHRGTAGAALLPPPRGRTPFLDIQLTDDCAGAGLLRGGGGGGRRARTRCWCRRCGASSTSCPSVRH